MLVSESSKTRERVLEKTDQEEEHSERERGRERERERERENEIKRKDFIEEENCFH